MLLGPALNGLCFSRAQGAKRFRGTEPVEPNEPPLGAAGARAAAASLQGGMMWVPADSLSGPSSEDGSGSEATTDFSSGMGTEDSGGASSPDISYSAAAELEGSKLPWEMTAAEIAGVDALALGIPTPTEVFLGKTPNLFLLLFVF